MLKRSSRRSCLFWIINDSPPFVCLAGLLKFCTVGFCGIGTLIDFILIAMQVSHTPVGSWSGSDRQIGTARLLRVWSSGRSNGQNYSLGAKFSSLEISVCLKLIRVSELAQLSLKTGNSWIQLALDELTGGRNIYLNTGLSEIKMTFLMGFC